MGIYDNSDLFFNKKEKELHFVKMTHLHSYGIDYIIIFLFILICLHV